MLEPKILYKNKNFLVLNKPAGLLVHPIRSRPAEGSATATLGRPASNGVNGSVLNREELNTKEETLTDWLVKKYPQIKSVGDDTKNRPGIVHRLDKETSGVMLVALNQKTFEYLKKLFQNHEIKKTYLALVYGNVRSDKFLIDKPIGIKSGTTRHSVHSSKMSKEAITEFEVVKRLKIPTRAGGKNQDLTLLRAYPKTGRTHQIRVHLASIHCPVVGDKLYGPKKELFPWLAGSEINRQFLHAEVIEFKDKKGKPLKFKAGLPLELRIFLKSVE